MNREYSIRHNGLHGNVNVHRPLFLVSFKTSDAPLQIANSSNIYYCYTNIKSYRYRGNITQYLESKITVGILK